MHLFCRCGVRKYVYPHVLAGHDDTIRELSLFLLPPPFPKLQNFFFFMSSSNGERPWDEPVPVIGRRAAESQPFWRSWKLARLSVFPLSCICWRAGRGEDLCQEGACALVDPGVGVRTQ